MSNLKIYLLPLGLRNSEMLGEIAHAVNETFGLSVELLPRRPIPVHTFNSGRGQYHSTAILHDLHYALPLDALRLLAITDEDIYVPQMNFVFGEAEVDGRTSIISLHRLRPEFYGDRPDQSLYEERAIKEAVHELGHTFGLRHCKNPRCVMFFSNNIRDTDKKSAEFLDECREHLFFHLRPFKAAA